MESDIVFTFSPSVFHEVIEPDAMIFASTRLYAGGELQGRPVGQALAGHKRSFPLAVVLPPPARGPGTLIPSAQRLVWVELLRRVNYCKSVTLGKALRTATVSR